MMSEDCKLGRCVALQCSLSITSSKAVPVTSPPTALQYSVAIGYDNTTLYAKRNAMAFAILRTLLRHVLRLFCLPHGVAIKIHQLECSEILEH